MFILDAMIAGATLGGILGDAIATLTGASAVTGAAVGALTGAGAGLVISIAEEEPCCEANA